MMTQQLEQELLAIKQRTIDEMVIYMKFGGAEDSNDPIYDPEFDSGYTQEHVDQCAQIIDDFIASLDKTPEENNGEYITGAVKTTILKLNELNEACDGCLIETSQREDLCDLIITGAQGAGLESSECDITEEWREW